MADYMHHDSVTNTNANANGLLFPNDHSLGHDLTSANSMELFVQQEINRQQLLSPTLHQRHDSLFQCSPSSTPRASISQLQAEGHPYVLAPTAPHNMSGYPLRPLNMSRSASQYSSTSSGHHRRYGSQHRASRGSFGNASPPMAPNMSPSTSQYSITSTVRQPRPLNASSQTCHDPASYFATQPLNLPPTTTPLIDSSSQTARYTGDPMVRFEINDSLVGMLAIEENGSKALGQVTISSG